MLMIFINTQKELILSHYILADYENISHLDTYPGEPPFLRGPKATMYTGSHGQFDNMQVFQKSESE